MVLTPCPISGFFDMMVTMPSGAMRMNALIGAAAAIGAARAASTKRGSTACNSRPPPAATLAFRKARREGAMR